MFGQAQYAIPAPAPVVLALTPEQIAAQQAQAQASQQQAYESAAARAQGLWVIRLGGGAAVAVATWYLFGTSWMTAGIVGAVAGFWAIPVIGLLLYPPTKY